MEAGKTDITYGQKMTALNELLTKVTDRRTIVEFTIAEKIEPPDRIEASSWQNDEGKYARAYETGCVAPTESEADVAGNQV